MLLSGVQNTLKSATNSTGSIQQYGLGLEKFMQSSSFLTTMRDSLAQQYFDRASQDYSNNINVSNWNMQNQYNSPANQQKLFEQAGYKYTPNGQSTTAGTVSAASPVNGVNIAGLQGVRQQEAANEIARTQANTQRFSAGVNALTTCLDSVMSARLKEAEADKFEQDTLNERAKSGYYKKFEEKIDEEILGMKLDNYVKEHAKDANVGIVQANLDLLKKDMRKADYQLDLLELDVKYAPDRWDYQRSVWNSEKAIYQYESSLKETEAFLRKTYGEEETKQRIGLMKQQYSLFAQQIQEMKFFNRDDYRQALLDFTTAQAAILGADAGYWTNDAVKESRVMYTQAEALMKHNEGVLSSNDMQAISHLKIEGLDGNAYEGYAAYQYLQQLQIEMQKYQAGANINAAAIGGSKFNTVMQLTGDIMQKLTGSMMNVGLGQSSMMNARTNRMNVGRSNFYNPNSITNSFGSPEFYNHIMSTRNF